jgi:hypothetical protein
VERFPARQYFKTEGRWISPDPAGLSAVDLTNPQSLNRYAYVNNNPLGLVDPTGMFTEQGGGAGGGGNGGGQVIQLALQSCEANLQAAIGQDPKSFYQKDVSPAQQCANNQISAPAPNYGSGSGGGGGTPAKSGNCPSVPTHPANYSPRVLYDFGVNASNSLSDNLTPDLAKTLAYAGLVAPNQAFDFKNQPSPGANPQYREYGNFAFGVFGYSLGFSPTYIKWGAGVASYGNMLMHLKIPKPSWGTPVTGSPYGDNPLEQQEIQNGYQWAQMHAAGKC